MFGYKEEEIRLYTQVEKMGETRGEKIPEEGKGHMKRKFSCALKFYLVISNIQAGNMRLKFNIICRLVMPLQLVRRSYGSDVRVYTFIPVQEDFQVDYIADRKVLNGCVYIGVFVAQIRLNGEGIGSAVLGNGEV